MSTATTNGEYKPIDYALAYCRAGLSIVPIRGDGSKAPIGSWTRHQNIARTEEEVLEDWRDPNIGIAVIYGKVSGSAELIDIDDANLFEPYKEAVEHLCPGLIEKLSITRTPRPGIHLNYKSTTIEGNQKLAQRWGEDGRPKTLIETRGEGGYALAPGTPACCHETGRTYDRISGPKLTQLNEITPEEREILFAVARTFNEIVEEIPEDPQTQQRGALSPGDDYNQNANWEEILAPHGWQYCFTSGGIKHWLRPGKTKGTSATTGSTSKTGNELFCVFSTNASPFEGGDGKKACTSYSKFSAYALLNHGGDYTAAAIALTVQGYGDRPSGWNSENKTGQPKEKSAPKAKPKKNTPKLIPPYRPFPYTALPPTVGRYVGAVSEAIGCDTSFVALPLLASLARAIGNSRTVRLKNTWHEPAVVWAAIVGKSGTHKSPAQSAGLQFIENIEAKSWAAMPEKQSQYETEMAQYSKDLANWKNAKTTDQPPWKPDEPTCNRFVASDTTIEALAAILASQFDGLLVQRDELSGWLGGIAEYKGGKGSDLGHWLACWQASPMTVDRKSGERRTMHVPRAAVSLVGGIQPSVLRQALAREHMQNGLCARLLFAMPPAKKLVWTEATVPDDAYFGMTKLFEDLCNITPADDGEGVSIPYPLGLSPEAKDLWISYYNRHGEEQVDLDEDQAAAWSKLTAYTARFALIFQLCVNPAAEEIDGQSMESAIELSEWFGYESKRVYGLFGEDQVDKEARELVEWIRSRGGQTTVRDLTRGPRKYRGNTELAEEDLNELVEAGHGEWALVPPGEVGGRATSIFRLSPRGDGDTTP